MRQDNKAYIVQLVKQIVHPYFAEEIADILIAHGMTFKTEPQTDEMRMIVREDNKAYIVPLVKQIVPPYFAEEIADILVAHGMTFKTEPQTNADETKPTDFCSSGDRKGGDENGCKNREV